MMMKQKRKHSEKEIQQLVCAYKQKKDEHVINEVLDALYGLIHDIASKRPEKGAVKTEDMIQEGQLALLQAIEQYNPQQSEAFVSYARNYIADAIRIFYTQYCLPINRPGRSLAHIEINPIDHYIFDTEDAEGNAVAPILPPQLVEEMVYQEPTEREIALDRAIRTLSEKEQKQLKEGNATQSLLRKLRMRIEQL